MSVSVSGNEKNNKIAIKTALISVSDKTNLDSFVTFLNKCGVEIIATGGTFKYIKSIGISVTEVSEYAGSPEVMDGRVKTLHPKVHAGFLAKMDDEEHLTALKNLGAKKIDLAVINLYPFVQTVQKTDNEEEIIENIDIGGPAMLRSCAKNFAFTTVVTDAEDYNAVIDEMKRSGNNSTSLSFRANMARKAFCVTAEYDSQISNWFCSYANVDFSEIITYSARLQKALRYGENAHQKAALYKTSSSGGVVSAKQLQGKELSYNNINDANNAVEIAFGISANADETNGNCCCVIVKHASPCGIAISETAKKAYEGAFNADSVSAFGGIAAFNCEVDEATAQLMVQTFFEVIVATGFTEGALEIFAKKKNLRLLVLQNEKSKLFGSLRYDAKFVREGILLQQPDNCVDNAKSVEVVSGNISSEKMRELLLAYGIVKYVKSNAIVVLCNGVVIGIGASRTNRVDSVEIACKQAKTYCEKFGIDFGNCVLASDAFFPFADNIEMLSSFGITHAISTKGSVNDNEVIKKAKELNICLAFAANRHFKH